MYFSNCAKGYHLVMVKIKKIEILLPKFIQLIN